MNGGVLIGVGLFVLNIVLMVIFLLIDRTEVAIANGIGCIFSLLSAGAAYKEGKNA